MTRRRSSIIPSHGLQQPLLSPPSVEDEETVFTSGWREVQLLVFLAAPTVIIQLGFSVPGFLVASYIGRNFGLLHLDGFSLANLTGNLFTLSILEGLYTASDTLGPQAYYAGRPKEVGIIAIRGFIGSMMVVLPIITILFFFLRQLLVAVGEDEQASDYAKQWYQIYALALPFYAIYMCGWKFLSAQNTMRPLLVVSTLGVGVVLPIGLEFFPRYFGFQGTAMAILANQVFQTTALLAYLAWFQPHNVATWPGLKAWRQAINYEALVAYLKLGAGGVLACSSWIYWETLTTLIGAHLGPLALSVHTIPTQVLLIGYMIPSSVGISLSIRLGAILMVDVRRAQKLALACAGVALIVFAAMPAAIFYCRHFIFGLFTHNEDVVAGVEEIWFKVCFYLFNTSMFAINFGIATSLGIQSIMGTATLLILWLVAFPTTYILAFVQGGGLEMVWTCLWPPYSAINLVMAVVFVTRDWDALAENMRKRQDDEAVGECSHLLVASTCDYLELEGSSLTHGVDAPLCKLFRYGSVDV